MTIEISIYVEEYSLKKIISIEIPNVKHIFGLNKKRKYNILSNNWNILKIF